MREIDPSMVRRDQVVPELEPNDTDEVVGMLKVAASFVPYVGSVLTELLISKIPQQRQDRIVEYIRQLDAKISELDANMLAVRVRDADAGDLVVKGGRLAMMSSRERIEQIASIVKNGLSQEAHDAADHSLLLDLLGQLDDVQMIMLTGRGHSLMPGEERNRYYEQHAAVLQKPMASFGGRIEVVEKSALWKVRESKLIALGLLEEVVDPKKIDPKTGVPKVKSRNITTVGRLHASCLRHRVSRSDASE